VSEVDAIEKRALVGYRGLRTQRERLRAALDDVHFLIRATRQSKKACMGFVDAITCGILEPHPERAAAIHAYREQFERKPEPPPSLTKERAVSKSIKPARHTFGGNCRQVDMVYLCKACGIGNLCDVCHKHDEPRGDCDKCQPCPTCEASEIDEGACP